MDTKKLLVWFDLALEPIGANPMIEIALDDMILYDDVLVQQKTFGFKHCVDAGEHELSVRLYGKTECDADQAIKIQGLTINGIRDEKFIWRGIYTPAYPQPWFDQQIAAGKTLSDQLSDTDYLGWNGVWRLRFTAPVFTWIHQTLDLGWIYD